MDTAAVSEQPILFSDGSTKCLSNRVKQNVQGCKEVVFFLKKRATIEEEHAKGLQRLSHSLLESIHRADVKQGSFSAACSAMARLHDLVAHQSTAFTRLCNDISDELLETSKDAERARKVIKDTATKADRLVHEAESARDKAKQRHELLVDELDRSQGAEPNKKPTFSFKPGRTALSQKQLDDLRARLDTAEVDWRNKTENAHRLRLDLASKVRPTYVRDFMALIQETDASLALHLNRFARISEDLLLSQASVVLPTSNTSGFASVLASMDNDADLEAYLSDYGTANEMYSTKLPEEQGQRHTSLDHHNLSMSPNTLAELVEVEETSVPHFVQSCCHAILVRGCDVEGIYRVTGQPSLVQRLRQLLSQGVDDETFLASITQEADVHAAASLLKQFFRDLPDSLIPRSQYTQFISAAKIAEEQQRRIALHQAVNDLPDANYSTLRFFLLHLKKIEARSAKNLMTASNLAIVLGPTLLDKLGVDEMT